MGTRLNVLRFGGSLNATVPGGIVEANVGYVPRVLGENLAGQVDAWVMEQGLGYYPALDFFRDRPAAVDPALLLLIDEVARYCCLFAEREIKRRLSRAFSTIEVTQTRAHVYALPRVRPSRGGAPADLAAHYTPNRIRAELVVSSIQKPGAGDSVQLARRQIRRWLDDVFKATELVTLRRLDGA